MNEINTAALKRFFDDKEMMQAWSEFLLDRFNEEALDRVYHRKSSDHIADAYDIVSKSFAALKDMFTEPAKPRKKPRSV